MSDATGMFFESLHRRGYEPLLEKASGTVRIDLHEGAHTDHWVVKIEKGYLDVCQEQAEADAILGAAPELFERLVNGRTNAIAAMLRGDVTVAGNLKLILGLERLFPGPPEARGPQHAFGESWPR